MLPEIGKTYNYFDDGKIKERRKSLVTITEIVPFDKIDEETLLLWEIETKDCDWLYAKETDFFIKGNLHIDKEIVEIVFVRTVKNNNSNNNWFSLGFWSGRLDVDNSLTDSLNNKNIMQRINKIDAFFILSLLFGIIAIILWFMPYSNLAIYAFSCNVIQFIFILLIKNENKHEK